MTDYQGDELKTEVIVDQDLDIVTDYCLSCPCGKMARGRQSRDGLLFVDHCPRTPKHHAVYFHPQTGEKYQRWCHQLPNKPTTCEIAVAATSEEIYLHLKDLLIIPAGWTLEVEEDNEHSNDYLDLDMVMTLHRIPDPVAYDKWKQDVEQARKSAYREEEIARLRRQLAQLTGENQ